MLILRGYPTPSWEVPSCLYSQKGWARESGGKSTKLTLVCTTHPYSVGVSSGLYRVFLLLSLGGEGSALKEVD